MQTKQIVGIAAAGLVIFVIALQLQVDLIVHGTLYNYGLIFDLSWANIYWMLQRVSLTFMIIAVLLIVISTAMSSLVCDVKLIDKELEEELKQFLDEQKKGKKPKSET